MLVIFGLSRKEHFLAALPRSCGRCGHGGPQALVRRTTRFSLFFVPVLPLRSRHEVVCRWCGATATVSRDEATRLRAAV